MWARSRARPWIIYLLFRALVVETDDEPHGQLVEAQEVEVVRIEEGGVAGMAPCFGEVQLVSLY